MRTAVIHVGVCAWLATNQPAAIIYERKFINMKLTDIIALAKAGYSASDVKDLLNANIETPAPEPEPEQPVEAEETEPDYKTMYEEKIKEIEALKKENEKTTNELKQAQKVNSHADLSNADNIENPEDILTKFFSEMR